MSSIDVLLQAADFLERQQQFSSLSSSYESGSGGGGSTSSSLSSASSRVVSLSPYFLASSSLSPPLSSASSTSSSCFGSPSGSRGTATTDNNNNNNTVDHLLSSSSTSPLEIKHFHKKFSPSKGLDPQVLTSKFSFSSSQSNGNAASSSSSSSSAAYHNVLYPSPSSSISSDCSNSGSGFDGSSSGGTKLKLKTNSHSGIVSDATACSSSSLDRMDDAKRDKALHNTLEKNRRAHLKDCFENLQNELPQYKEKKATNLAILNYTVKYIDACHRKNRDFEREKAMLLKRQNLLKQALEQLVTDIKMNDKDFDLKKWQATSASSTSYNSGANDLKSDYLSKVDLQMKSSSPVNGENAVASFASDYLDDSTASTSTASEANDYATIDSRAKRNIIHNKSSGASSSLKPLVSLKYQRKRSSNSLNLPSINIGNIHMNNNNNNKPVIATKIIKLDEHPASSQQVKLSSRGGSGNGGTQNRQRHYSVDESMIKSKQKKRQINICDDTTEDYLLEDEEDEDEEFDYEYDDEDEEMVTSMDEMDDNDDSENELVINEDANTTAVTLAPPAQKIVKLQTFSRSISNNSNESSSMFHHQHRSSPSLDITNGSIKSSSLNGNLENLKLVLNENTTRHSQKPILSLNASNGVGAQYIITSNQNNNTSNSVTGGGNKQIQIINKSTATTTTTSSGGHSFNHPSLQVKHHPYAFTTTTSSSNTNTQQNQHLTDSALKYQINVGQK